ncbi:xanthine dehydrogenase family protein subunit M [Aliiroseovarius subalbicans]|uniref:FAD binding domain-containing protein n=1 Tax=Aliiroseovarius subalbicans TaxID=2925840 RepID=UPI001F57DF4D|nr:xanthine dehydrogenase family protein subunit M [Aliiroseovarius subalbicans]MCI2398970.1 xanthine dehydrogenase family protein subunit M [Aliiroseovarius subalbicans]
MKASVGGYARATDLQHAIKLLDSADGMARVLAGGQSLVAAMNMRLTAGDLLVDISRLSELRGVTDEGDTIRIGALTRHVEVGDNALIKEHAPLLADAVKFIAHATIRNRGTIGGALAHADPAAEFPACVLALGATLQIMGPDGGRTIAVEDFFLGLFETDLEPEEVLMAITIPKAEAGERQVLQEVTRRSGDYALAGLCLVKRQAGHRLTMLSVGEQPELATGAMAMLDAGNIDGAVAALRAEIDPSSDTNASASYRRHIAGVLLRRAVDQMTGDVR